MMIRNECTPHLGGVTMDWNKSENEKLRKADLRLSHIYDQSLSSEAVGQQTVHPKRVFG